MARILAFAILCTTLVAHAYTPAYLEDVKKNRCTFGGVVSDGCVALYTDVVSGTNPLHISNNVEDKLRSCFSDATNVEKRHGDHFEAAEELFARKAANDPAVANTYVDACLSATDLVHDKAWLPYEQQKAFYAGIKDSIAQGFEATCGTRADLTLKGIPTVVLFGKPSKKSVFFEGTDPSGGGTIKVMCSGVIEGKGPGVKPYKTQPTTMAAVMSTRSDSCRSNCEMNEDVCQEGASQGHATTKCVNYCKRKCQ